MKYFIILFILACVLLFLGACIMTKVSMKEQEDPEFHKKMQKIRSKVGPITWFVDNLFYWCLAFAVIWFVFLR